MDIRREVVFEAPKTSDVRYTVSVLHTPHGKYLDFREFVVSMDDYGRGVTMPADLWRNISAAVGEELTRDADDGADDPDPLPVV